MKNLKMFAIAVMAFAVMAMGVHAEGETELSTKITGCTGSTCKLTAENVLELNDEAGYVVSKNLTIQTSSDAGITLAKKLIVKADKTLTIKGGNVTLNNGADITIEAGAKLIIRDAAKDVVAITTNLGAKITVENEGKLSVIDNLGKGFVGKGGQETGAFTITLNYGDMEVSRNGSNAMNGSTIIDATGATITAEGNGETGLNAQFHLHRGSKIVAKNNGLTGVTLSTGSEVDAGCTIESTGNLTKKDDAYIADRSDLSIKGNVTLSGDIKADSIGLEKVSWTNPAQGKVTAGALELVNNAQVDVKTIKSLCDTSNALEGQTITCNADKLQGIDLSGLGVVIEGTTATTYGAAKVTLTSNVKKVIIDDENAQVTVAEGTEVENKTGSTIRVFTTDGKYVEVEAEKTAQIGEPTPGEPGTTEPGDQTTGDGNQGPTDNVKNPDTNDNILVYAGLGLVSLASVAFTTRKRED